MRITKTLVEEYLNPDNWSFNYTKVANKLKESPAKIRYQILTLQQKKLLNVTPKMEDIAKIYVIEEENKDDYKTSKAKPNRC